jgi:hypothetical protein
MATKPHFASPPLVTDILFIAHGGRRDDGIAIEFLDADGASLASGKTDATALEALAHRAIGVATAARVFDPAVSPRSACPRASASLHADRKPRSVIGDVRGRTPRGEVLHWPAEEFAVIGVQMADAFAGRPRRTPASILRAQAAEDRAAALTAERHAKIYMLVALAALLLSCGLVSWAIWS